MARGQHHSYRARDYDALIDAPVEAGAQLRVASARLGSSRVRIAVARHGRRAYALARKLVAHLRTIARAQRTMMGPLPYRDYLVGLHFRPGYRFTGLEHEGGTVVYAPQSTLDGKSGYRDLLHVLAHEHFHLWNGKRVRPAPHARYDYLRLQPSRTLWLTEGCTEYFARRTLRRIGALSANALLAELGRGLDEVRQAPERKRLSLGDIAYRAFWPPRDPSQPELSYYAKGQVACLMIDLEMRARTAGRSGMLSVMRELDQRARSKPGYAVDRRELLDAIRSVSKLDLTRELARWIDQPGDLDVRRQLLRFGVRIKRKVTETSDYGFDAERRVRGVLAVSKVRRGGPGALAGLIPHDQILLIDGRPTQPWPGWHHQLRARRQHRLVVLRAGRTMTLRLRTTKRKTSTFVLLPPKQPSALYRGWNR